MSLDGLSQSAAPCSARIGHATTSAQQSTPLGRSRPARVWRAEKILYKGAFQVGDPSGKWSLPFNLSIRQPANTGVVRWASRLLALFERDLPYQLDDALRTQGPSTLSVLDGAPPAACPAQYARRVRRLLERRAVRRQQRAPRNVQTPHPP